MPAKKRVLKPQFSISKLGFGIVELEAMVHRVSSLSSWAKDLASAKEFQVSGKEEVHLITLSPRDMGFRNWPTRDEWLSMSFLASWSRDNLDCQLIEICACDDAYYLRAKYINQPKGESLAVAMKPLTINDHGDVAIFHVDHYPEGLWLYARHANCSPIKGTDDKWPRYDLDDRWVFRISNNHQ